MPPGLAQPRRHRLPGSFWLLAVVWLALPLTRATAQGVPQLLNYQGRVAVGGTNFTGTGYFKFALVNASGTQTYWSNDNTSAAGSQPTAAVNLTVTGGLYAVLLGDSSIANMTAVPPSVFANADVRLRVWFNDGTSNGSQLLSPDQRVAAVGYALMADGVKAGGVTGTMIAAGAVGTTQLGANAVTAANIASGAVGSSQLATGAVQSSNLAPGVVAANLVTSGQTGVASGGLVLSPIEDASLLAAGYIKIGSTVLADSWQQRSNGTAPSTRSQHTATWTGAEMIVWGGQYAANGYRGDGARYNPVTNTWTALSTAGAPTPRAVHTAVWTGTEMIVWGGSNFQPDGGRYNPMSNSWITLPTAGAPAVRFAHTAVWTGTEMIVWGGYGTSTTLNDGGRYSPSANTWTALPTSGAPAGRAYHSVVWSGAEMIVWGGYDGGSTTYYGDGARFSPSANAWTTLPTTGEPAARFQHTAVWSGTEMIVWGGFGTGGLLNDGARFSPSANAWTTLPTTGAPAVRYQHTAVWTGTEMIVWGGAGNSNGFAQQLLSDGARYNVAANAWTALPAASAPGPRALHTAVWSGTEMIVWGGGNGDYFSPQFYNDGGRYNPSANAWNSLAATSAPSARDAHTAVWTGTEMIVWGGYNNASSKFLNDGSRYNPAANVWTALSTTGAPTARWSHTAVWSGGDMIVWGGFSGSNNYTGNALNDGARYNPAANAWTALPTAGAPSARSGHTAVWSGTEMIVWGGFGGGSVGYFNSGARYNPAANAWTALPTAGAPSAREAHTAVWSGTEMIIWGGLDSINYFGDGARYNPTSNAWTVLPSTNAPSIRYSHSAVWTGTEMIIWGGHNSQYVNDGSRYNPASNTWTTLPTAGAPLGRYNHNAVWTGTDMIVWGGLNDNTVLGDGGRYNFSTNTWTALATAGAPSPRYYFTSVWSGTEMIVWGGYGTVDVNDLISYTPGRVMYLYQRP